MSDELSFMDDVEKRIDDVQTELENKRKELLEAKKLCEPFKKIYELQEYKDVEKTIKEDFIYPNLFYTVQDSTNDFWVKKAWGLKQFLEIVKLHAERYDEVIKELSEV